MYFLNPIKRQLRCVFCCNKFVRSKKIDALPEIVKAVGDKVEIYVDGGIRDGTDIFKALALGARMVFIGRPMIWGLFHKGEEGVKNILKILANELDKALAISGCADLDAILRDNIVHESYYSKI